MSAKYKLLILEGGGFFGLIDITFLTYLRDDYVVTDHIDSISGCSIGGIETCALMAGCTPKDIQQAFIDHGSDIFKRRSINPLDIPWYSDKGLTTAIKKFVGDKKVKDTRLAFPHTSMFVPALDMSENKLKVYDNVSGSDDERSLLDISLATSAACIYFPVRDYYGHAITDGGLREVAPVITHATGLKNKVGVEFADMDVLVICAGESIDRPKILYDDVKDWSVVDWMTKWIINDITASNRATSKFWGENMGFNSFQWFNPIKITGALDDVSQADYILTECEMYKEQFLDVWDKFMS